MTIRITAACPALLVPDANHMAMVLARGLADNRTYGPLNWQDADGNLYSCASWEATEPFVQKARSALSRPDWDKDTRDINMTGAGRAQQSMVFWMYSEDNPNPPKASPTKLTAIGGMTGPEAVAAMGLVQVDHEKI